MASISRNSKKSRVFNSRPVMNVTPLVDVVLVLLIIFMVVIPALEEGLKIDIPGIFHVDAKTENKVDPLVLSITESGEIYVDDREIPAGRLKAVLTEISKRQRGRRLVLRADKKVQYAEVRRLYRTIQQIGFPGISLRVNQRKSDEEKEQRASRSSEGDRRAVARLTAPAGGR